MPSHDPTITSVRNNGNPVPLQGNHYDLCTGEIVVTGSTGNNGDEFFPEQVDVKAWIDRHQGSPAQVTPANTVTYGAPGADKSRTYTATWDNYTLTGGGQALEVQQIQGQQELTGATVNIH